jgi:hypothetical protein
MLAISGGILMAQDTVRTLVITEAKMDRNETSYLELTNMGDVTLDLSMFEVGMMTPWNVPQEPGWPETSEWVDRQTIERLPAVMLAPGESYVIGTVSEFTEEAYAEQVAKFGYSPDWQPFFTNKKMWKLIDLPMYKDESAANDPRDSVSFKEGSPLETFDQMFETWGGRDVFYVRYHSSPTDSAVIDQVGGLFTDPDGSNPDGGMQQVAGIEDATGTHYLMRRFSVKKGNTTFVQGSDYEDSEWIPVPFLSRNPYDPFRECEFGPFWTVGNHVNAVLVDGTLTAIEGSPISVDFGAGSISVPWGVRNNDSIMYQFEYTPGLAWHYDFNGVHEDSAYSSVRTGDTLTVYAIGNSVTIKSFHLEVQAPTNSEARVIPKYHPTDRGDYVGVTQPYFKVSEGVPGMDTIRQIPFACRIDTLFLYLEKAPNASWSFEFVDGVERVDLKDGDKLVVTAEDGTTTKEYYLKLQRYRKARNAELSAIRWPDIPEFYLGSFWESDTIPNFNAGITQYDLALPPGVNSIPGLVAKNADDNARHSVERAVSLVGSAANRTISFHSVAEDDTTEITYQVTLKKTPQPQDIQPWDADPFISQLAYRTQWANTHLEVVNPGTELMDMSHYMFVFSSLNDPALVISNNEDNYGTPEDYFNNRYTKYIPGRVWADTSAWDANPGTVDPNPDGNVNTIVQPGDVFVIGDITSTDWAYAFYGNENWEAENLTDVEFGEEGKNGSEGAVGYPSQPKNDPVVGWHGNPTRWYLFKIVGEGGDSVRAGLKPATDPNDFVLVDLFGNSVDETPVVNGEAIDQGMGFTRKPEIYQGNPIYGDLEGGSFGTDDETSEWIMVTSSDFTNLGYHWRRTMLAQAEGIGSHFMYPATFYLSTVSSLQLKVSEGYSMEETIRGVVTGTTVDDFLSMLVKKDEEQTLTVKSGDTEITGATAVSNGDVLLVTSADGSNNTQYTLEVTDDGLSSDAVLTSSTLDIVAEAPASVGGFELGSSVKDVLDAVNLPAGATMDILDSKGAYSPLKTINFDTMQVDVMASVNVYFDVTAEDGETKIMYQLQPAGDASSAYVTSTVFNVDQDAMLISLIPQHTSVRTFFENIVPAAGATVTLVAKDKQPRSDGEVAWDDVLEVVSEDGTNTAVYFLTVLDIIPNYLAYIQSEVYDVSQALLEIIGEAITNEVSVADFSANLIAAPGSSFEIQDATGAVKSGSDMLAEGDKVVVTSGNGVNILSYSVMVRTIGIDQENTGLRIYPNPSEGTFFLEGIEPGNRIRVYNSTGVSLLDYKAHDVLEQISLEGQPNGMYFITVHNGEKAISQFRVIKQ